MKGRDHAKDHQGLVDLGYVADPRFGSESAELILFLQNSLGHHANTCQSAVRLSGFPCLRGSLNRRSLCSSLGLVSCVFSVRVGVQFFHEVTWVPRGCVAQGDLSIW